MGEHLTSNTTTAWREPLRSWQKALEEELTEILHFWAKHMVDHERSGFYGRMNGYGQLVPTADKGVILNTRILWTFSAAARHSGRPDYAGLAHRAYGYLFRFFHDQEYGGVYWMLDYNGRPVNTRKQVYAQAFAIYALAEYYQLTGDIYALHGAMDLFALLERYSRDPLRGGYFEAFGRDWQPIEDLRLSDKDANEAKTMNTHLHVLEAYTTLYRVAPTADLCAALRQLIKVFLDYFIDTETGHLNLFFDENWQLKSRTVSFGHDIECSWLLLEAAEVLADQDLLRTVARISLKMAEATRAEGLDTDGALMNERTSSGHQDTDRHWWPQAEAMVGFLNAYQLSGEDHWIQLALKIWTFIRGKHKDPATGEWHWRVNARGEICREEDLAGPWKAPYHNGRACMELIRRIGQI